jgi:hypothetical protein
MSQSGSLKGSSGSGGSGIQTINGDVGSITGSTVTIYTHQSTKNSGQTVEFVNSGAISTLNVTDTNNNTTLGKLAGNAALLLDGGSENTTFGASAGASLGEAGSCTLIGYNSGSTMTSDSNQTGIGANSLALANNGQGNTAGGFNCLNSITSGSYNTAYGLNSGALYTGTESSNILIANGGVLGESHIMRLGTQGSSAGEVNKAFMAGITGATPTSGNTPQVVLCDNAGQLTTISSSTAGYVLTSNGTGTPSFQPGGGGFTPVNFSVKLSGNIANVTGDNTQYKIIYDTVVFDSASGYSTITGLYTFPTTGIYQINLLHFVYGGSAAQIQFLGYLFVNGATNIRLMDANPGALGLSAGGEFIASATYLYSATAGDTMAGYVQVGNATKNVGVAGGTESCLFSGFRVA